MTDNEIVRALECHMSKSLDDCEKCPFYAQKRAFHNCHEHLYESLLALINRQKAEIEEMKETITLQAETLGTQNKMWKTARNDGIKLFADVLKAHYPHSNSVLRRIDVVMKEMVGE